MSIDALEEAKEIAEGLKSEKTFDARKAITGATYPQDSIEVYSDAALAHELNIAANEAAKARFLAQTIREKFATDPHNTVEADPDDAPGWREANTEAEELEAKVAELVTRLRGSVLTFHVRGLAPVQWRLIDKKWRKEIKPPARNNYDRTPEGEEEYELEVYERNLSRNAAITCDTIASAIIKVTNSQDETDSGVWTQEQVSDLNDTYLESEFNKIKSLVEQLTFANNLFQIAVEQDADFLSKP